MKDRIPSITAVLLLILLVAGTWWASDYTLRSIQIDPPRRITHERDSWSDSFVMVLTNPEGIASDRLEGSSMNHFPDTDSYEITDARAVSQKPDTPITVGTSDRAVLDQNGTRIVMTGHAHLHRPAGPDRNALDVRSDQLTLKPDEDLVYTDKPAVVINGHSTLRGTGMRYNNRSRQLIVYSSSDVKISGEDRQPSQDTGPSPKAQP